MKLLVEFLLALLPVTLVAQPGTINVKTSAISEKNRQKVFRSAVLTLDDLKLHATVSGKDVGQIDFAYDSVKKVVIEPDVRVTYNAGAALAGFALGGAAFGGRIAEYLDNPVDMSHTVYLEYKKPDNNTARLVLSVSKENVPAALKRIQSAFGERVFVAAFSEVPEKLELKQLPTYKAQFVVKGNTGEHPLPVTRPDKALVVVACPTGNGLDAVRTDKFQNWAAYIVIDDQVTAVNAPGTYTFFYLDPGEYTLISQAGDANALRMKLEAEKEYHLIQTMYIAGRIKSFLTRHSKELVMHEIQTLSWSEWKPRE